LGLNKLLLNHIEPLIVLLAASLLDWLIGDPWGFPHPVQVMGWAIAICTKFILKNIKSALGQKLAGICLALGLMGVSAAIGWGLVHLADKLNHWLGLGLESILLASCLAGRSLREAAIAVLKPLQQSDLAKARTELSLYVGRDTESLDAPEILRAVLETVAENTTDGVIAPLFFGILGGVPLAIAYKTASTLDSMIGYKEAPYTNLGWFSAKFEDVLSWLPCRYTVLSLSLLSGDPLKVWRVCARDAVKDASPNSGWSEAAFAAALDVQLGGVNTYKGVVKSKPLLGDRIQPITPEAIAKALKLMRLSFLSLLLIGMLIRIIN
jgi:adenosylcobinamide-phosphate synthase